jgi:hypothetical protein
MSIFSGGCLFLGVGQKWPGVVFFLGGLTLCEGKNQSVTLKEEENPASH